MFETQQKSTGTQYTTTVALLVMAFVFSPALVVASRAYGYMSLSLAVVCSAVFVALAWVNWKKHSALTITSIAARGSRGK